MKNNEDMSSSTLLFLCSGGGGNLRFVHRAIQNAWLSRWQRIAVIADRECPATDFARQHSLETRCLDFSESGQNGLVDTITDVRPDVTLTTVHRILKPQVLAACDGPILNLHYSLLPAFSGTIGTTPVKAAKDYGTCLVGATVHEVTDVLDGGNPLVQIALPTRPAEAQKELMDTIFRSGCFTLFTALKIFDAPQAMRSQEAPLMIKGRHALINPSTEIPITMFDDNFWQALK